MTRQLKCLYSLQTLLTVILFQKHRTAKGSEKWNDIWSIGVTTGGYPLGLIFFLLCWYIYYWNHVHPTDVLYWPCSCCTATSYWTLVLLYWHFYTWHSPCSVCSYWIRSYCTDMSHFTFSYCTASCYWPFCLTVLTFLIELVIPVLICCLLYWYFLLNSFLLY